MTATCGRRDAGAAGRPEVDDVRVLLDQEVGADLHLGAAPVRIELHDTAPDIDPTREGVARHDVPHVGRRVPPNETRG